MYIIIYLPDGQGHLRSEVIDSALDFLPVPQVVVAEHNTPTMFDKWPPAAQILLYSLVLV